VSASSSCRPPRTTSDWARVTPGEHRRDGRYCPVGIATEPLLARVRAEVFEPVLREVAAQGSPYEGVLYAGLMILPDGTPSVLEFNARFGDPETQRCCPRCCPDSASISRRSHSALEPRGEPAGVDVERAAVTTSWPHAGIPTIRKKAARSGFQTRGLGDDVIVFHAGTYRGQ